MTFYATFSGVTSIYVRPARTYGRGMPGPHPLIGRIYLAHHPWVLVVLLAIAAGYVLYTNRRR